MDGFSYPELNVSDSSKSSPSHPLPHSDLVQKVKLEDPSASWIFGLLHGVRRVSAHQKIEVECLKLSLK